MGLAVRVLSSSSQAVYRRQLRATKRALKPPTPKVARCAVCGAAYQARRTAKQPERRYCSDACKQAAYRQRKHESDTFTVTLTP